MLQKVLASCACLVLSLALATAGQAKDFSLIGGGGQLHIGNGLMLPIQGAAGPGTTTTMFPTLLVPVVPGNVVAGTTVKPLIELGGKRGFQRALTIPAGVLSKPAAQTTVGVKFSNPTAFAVGTNLNYVWPSAPSVFSTGAAVGTPVIAAHGGTMTYSNALGARFGGPASFSLAPGAAAGLFAAPVSVYIKINATTPACTHPLFPPGTDAGCLAGFVLAMPTGLAAIGGPTAVTVMTPGVVITGLNIAAVKMGLTPLGTITSAALVAMTPLPTNMATSQPGPWTTGRIVISNPAAGGTGELFTLSGRDDRTVLGRGTIQLVSGSLSTRGATGPNANRGWLRLVLGLGLGQGVPALSPLAQSAVVALVLLAGGYLLRRRSGRAGMTPA